VLRETKFLLKTFAYEFKASAIVGKFCFQGKCKLFKNPE